MARRWRLKPKRPTPLVGELTIFPDLGTTTGIRKSVRWKELFASDPFVRPPTRTQKKRIPLWSPAIFTNDSRAKGAVVERIYAAVLDYDQGTKLAEIEKLWSPYFGVVHSTFHHRATTKDGEPIEPLPRYRVIFPMARPVTMDEYPLLLDMLFQRARENGHAIDESTKNPSRVWFEPARNAAVGKYIVRDLGGEPLDPDSFLAQAKGRADADAVVEAGERNRTLTSLAGTLRRSGLTKEELLPALIAANYSRCRPPLADQEVSRIVESIGSYPVASAKTPHERQRLLAILEHLPMFRDPTGRAFVDLDGEVVACDSPKLVQRAMHLHRSAHGDLVAESIVKQAVSALAGRDLPKGNAALRFAGQENQILMDLGSDRRCVRIDGVEVAVVERSPVPFGRPSGSLILPDPVLPTSDVEAARTLGELRKALGLADDVVWHSVLAWLLSAMRPSGPYTILALRGEQGSGKTTLARQLRFLIDPRRPVVQRLPRDTRDLAILAEHAHVVVFDNLSNLKEDMADAICCLATGSGFSVKANYTDRDLTIFDAARPIVLTSITDAVTRSDLLDRSLLVTLPTRVQRAVDAELDARIASLRPRVLGALCYAAHRALGIPPVALPPEIRMAGPAGFAAAAERAMGLERGKIIEAYLRSKDEADDVGGSDPVVEAALLMMKKRREWIGPAAALCVVLEGYLRGPKPRDWPDSGRKMRAVVDRHTGLLRRRRILVETGERSTDRTRTRLIRLTRVRRAT